jgi:16S rRNA (adenine(1408)-N(1))-methyltransferase
MRILEGTKVVEAEAAQVEARLRGARQVVIDVGAGDGRFVYEAARRDPTSLYVGIDPDADAMAQYAYRADRKPTRGGVDNLLYIVVSLEQLPPELRGVAHIVHVNFPWAGLLRGVILPEADALEDLARLLGPDGVIEMVLTYDAEHDKAAFGGELLPPLDEAYIDGVLRPAYTAQGLVIETRDRLSREEALAIPSTWGRRLLHGRPRDVFHLRMRRV